MTNNLGQREYAYSYDEMIFKNGFKFQIIIKKGYKIIRLHILFQLHITSIRAKSSKHKLIIFC